MYSLVWSLIWHLKTAFLGRFQVFLASLALFAFVGGLKAFKLLVTALDCRVQRFFG